MSDIFLSYAREDKDRVQSFARALEQKGWSVWWDLRIRTGQRFPEVIQKALETSKTVVVVWTKRSVQSDWVMNEARRGWRRRVLFPVMLVEKVEIPLEFEHVHTAELMGWQPDQDHAGFNRFIDDLAEIIGAPVLPVGQASLIKQTPKSSPAPMRPTGESSSLPKTAAQVEPARVALEGNNNLSALNVSTGSLSPVFSTNTLNYRVNVASNIASVTISATKADPNAVMSEDVAVGSGTATGQATIQLDGPGTATIALITVTAPNGSSKTYRITVNRAALSGNNNLSTLSVSSGTLGPAFNAGTLSYTVDVASTVASVAVTLRLQDTTASLTVNGQATNSGQVRTIALSGPGSSTPLTIVVTAPNGAQKTYTVEVSRAAEVEPEPERLEPKRSATTAGAVPSYSPREPFRSQRAMEVSGVKQETAQAGEDHSSESPGTGQSTESLPYFPIGLGLLAAIGALAYFAIFSQGPSSQYQSAVQSPTTRTEVITPPPAPEPIKTPSAATTQEKPVVKQGVGQAKTITGKDGVPMMLIPAGEFLMGSREEDKSAQDDERPAHSVYLDAYYLDQYEVTTTRYATFFQETNRAAPPEYWPGQVPKHGRKPVVGMDWNDATAYCSWAGKRLPTEAEWEKAARGTDQRRYPWGNEEPTQQRANFDHCCDFKDYGVLTDVGLFEKGKSPYGAYDMAGNVSEWMADWYDANYYGKSPERIPKGPSSGQYRVIRGGSWRDGPGDVRSADRGGGTPSGRGDSVGFRCAQDVPK